MVATLVGLAARNMQLLTEIEEHGVYDGLTRCFNRTHGMKLLVAELKRAKRARTDFSLVMFDLDFFKSVNDEFGHLCGDALLAAVGKRLTTLFRNSDIRVRYGGEEFMYLASRHQPGRCGQCGRDRSQGNRSGRGRLEGTTDFSHGQCRSGVRPERRP